MRAIFVMVLAAAQVLGVAAAADTGSAQGSLPCETREPGLEVREVACPLIGTGSPRAFRFEAHFAGSHDDTKASLAASLDGAPLACEADSKTSLFAEDGEVSLFCRFSTTAPAGERQLLRMKVAWYHAQYTHFHFRPD